MFDRLLRAQNEWVAVCWKSGEKPWTQKMVPSGEAKTLTDTFTKQSRETFNSVASFKTTFSRRISNVSSISSNFLDLDYKKKVCLADKTPEEVSHLICERCKTLGIPPPSATNSTGNGIHVYWIFPDSVIGRENFDAWNRVQKTLLVLFEEFGADPGAVDLAHVMRVPGSATKPGVGGVCYSFASGPDVEFDAFAAAVALVAPVEKPKVVAVEPPVAFVEPVALPVVPFGQSREEGSLWQRRAAEIERLILHRFPDAKLPPKKRDLFIFLLAVSDANVNGGDVRTRAFELAWELAGWRADEAETRLCAVFRRSEKNRLYRFKNATIAQWLQIKPEEAIALNLHAIYPRGATSQKDRATARERKSQNKAIATAMSSEYCRAEIAKRVGVSMRTITRWRAEARSGSSALALAVGAPIPASVFAAKAAPTPPMAALSPAPFPAPPMAASAVWGLDKTDCMVIVEGKPTKKIETFSSSAELTWTRDFVDAITPERIIERAKVAFGRKPTAKQAAKALAGLRVSLLRPPWAAGNVVFIDSNAAWDGFAKLGFESLIKSIVPAAEKKYGDADQRRPVRITDKTGKTILSSRLVARAIFANPRERARKLLPDAYELWSALLDPGGPPPMAAMYEPVLHAFAEKIREERASRETLSKAMAQQAGKTRAKKMQSRERGMDRGPTLVAVEPERLAPMQVVQIGFEF